MVKEITQKDYLCLIGLLTLGTELMRQIKNIEEAAAQILEVEDEGHGYYGHVSDAIYSDDQDAVALLKRLDISIIKVKRKKGS